MATYKLKTKCAEQNRAILLSMSELWKAKQNRRKPLKKLDKAHITLRTGTCKPGGNSNVAGGGGGQEG
jgi:hypothetical protein